MVIDFVFRCDAGASIGIGHAMRCLTLANQLHQSGYQCAFVSASLPTGLIELIESNQHHIFLIKPDLLSDADMTRALINKTQNKPILIVDHYQLSKDWELSLKEAAKTIVVIDDLANREHHCDLLLDQTWMRLDKDYLGLVPAHCQLCCGSMYALLRPQFAQLKVSSLARRQQQHLLTNILISFGGSDSDGLTLQALTLLQPLAKTNKLTLTAIMGSTSPCIEQVRSFIANSPLASQMQLIVDCQNMATQLATADIAIGSAGGMTWERACLGVPSIMICEADNQKDIFAAFEREKLAQTLYPKPLNQLTGLAEQVQMLLQSQQKCQRLSQQSSKIVDGLGAERMAKRLISMEKSTA